MIAPASAATRLVRGAAGALTRRVPAADLDERDPDYIRDTLPRLWLLSTLWYRGEVRGMGNVPAEGPVVVVVGPEGGLTEEELATLTGAGASAVRLGAEVLRTSTAGVASVAAVLSRTARWA